MRNWKFIKTGNRNIEEIEKDLDMLKNAKEDYFHERETPPAQLLKRIDDLEKELKKAQEEGTKTGNENVKETNISGKNGSGVITRMNNLYFAAYNLSSGEKGIEKFPTESQAISFLKQKTGNESIDKQEWSIFKGLTKKAEEEIGNSKWEYSDGTVAEVEDDGTVIYTKKDGTLLKQKLWDKEYAEKSLSAKGAKKVGNKKTGNQSAQERFLDDIEGIKEKYKQEGKEINLSRLMYELKRIGWAESDFTKLRWPTNIGNETLAEYAKSKPRIINETKAERKFGKVMGEFEEGALKTPQGKTVTDPAQAKAIAYSEADKVDNLKRARNSMVKNAQITLWNGNDSVLISENGLVQYLENNSFETDRAKYDSQEKAVEELTKQGYHKK